jgi:hypothetical protein
MRKDKAGNKLYKKMTVKVLFPDAIFPDKTYVQHAGPKQGFGPEGVDHMLESIADQLDTLYPWWEFQMKEMTPVGSTIRFCFTYARPRAIPEALRPTQELVQP